MPYDLSDAALTKLRSGEPITCALLLELDLGTRGRKRWAWGDRDRRLGNDVYEGMSPFSGLGVPDGNDYRTILNLLLVDPRRLIFGDIRAAGEAGNPCIFREALMLDDRSLEVISTLILETTSLHDGPPESDRVDTIVGLAGPVLNPGSVETWFASSTWHKENVDATDTCFDEIHRGFDAFWAI